MPSSSSLPDFSALRIAVVGDVIADHYLFARPVRLSREAPVIVMRHAGERVGAGGAANVARNVRSLGARASLLGVVGRDDGGRELLRLLASERIELGGLVADEGWSTPTKTRVLGSEPGRTPTQVLRIDREPDAPLAAALRAATAERVRALAGSLDALLISDYGYGLVGEELAAAAREVQAAGALVVLDPRASFRPFRGLDAMTPNLGELARATERPPECFEDLAEVVRAAQELRARNAPRWLLVTMGNRGMALFSDEHPDGSAVPVVGSSSVVDVSGAGDTAAAAFTLGLAAGLQGVAAMRLANAAASLVVMESGAAVCRPAELSALLPRAPDPLALQSFEG